MPSPRDPPAGHLGDPRSDGGSAAVMLAGDFNVMPTELDVYKPER